MNRFDSSLLDGFSEGITFAALRDDQHRGPPASPGVYTVVYPFSSKPTFLKVGTGNWLKNKNPNVGLDVLEQRWIAGSRILYVGKAGSPGQSGTLHERIALLSGFGRGSKVGHWGGRLLWQLEGSAELLVRWLPTPDQVPLRVEGRLLNRFMWHYGRLPFANLTDSRPGRRPAAR